MAKTQETAKTKPVTPKPEPARPVKTKPVKTKGGVEARLMALVAALEKTEDRLEGLVAKGVAKVSETTKLLAEALVRVEAEPGGSGASGSSGSAGFAGPVGGSSPFDRRGKPIRPQVSLNEAEKAAAFVDLWGRLARDPFFVGPGYDWRPSMESLLAAIPFGKAGRSGLSELDLEGIVEHFRAFARSRFPGAADAAYCAFKKDHSGPSDAAQLWVFGTSGTTGGAQVTEKLPVTTEKAEVIRRAFSDAEGRPSWRGHRTLADDPAFRAEEIERRNRALSYVGTDASYGSSDNDLVRVLVATGLHVPEPFRNPLAFGAAADVDPRKLFEPASSGGYKPMTLATWLKEEKGRLDAGPEASGRAPADAAHAAAASPSPDSAS